MNLIELIRKDRMVAFKAKENIKKNLLGCLISDSTKIDKEPTDEVVLSIIKKFIKGLDESASTITKGNPRSFIKLEDNFDLYFKWESLMKEIIILESYLPKQMTEEDIRNIIKEFIEVQTKLGVIPALNLVMFMFKHTHTGKYDGALVSKLAKEIINEYT